MFMKKLVSVVLCLALLMASVIMLLPEMTADVSAATYVKGSNTAHSSYLTSKYYEHFTKLTFTGDGRTDVLMAALSQLGYRESSSVDNLSGIVTETTAGNYTEYNYNMGDWGGGYAYDWCATFCAWALLQSGCTDQDSISDWCRKHDGDGDTFDADYIWREVGCPTWAAQLRRTENWEYSRYRGGDYDPQSGDLIFFQNASSSSESHIGIVVYCDDTYVYTVEGNTSDQSGLEPNGNGVYFKKYEHGSSYIKGYGVLPYETKDIPKVDYTGLAPTTGLYIADRDKNVYSDETGNTVTGTISRFDMFEVVEVNANGRLKVNYENASGVTASGWIINSTTERVLQISTYATSEKVSVTIKCVDEKGNTLKSETSTGFNGSSVVIVPPAIEGYKSDLDKVSVLYKANDVITITYKPVLTAAILAASGTRYCDYSDSALATLRSVYAEAVALNKNSSAASAQKIAMADKLNKAIADTIYNETVVSVGKSYTATANDRTDKWADDGIRLTDGVKNKSGSTEGYSGWAKSTEIVVDLGSSVSSNVYTAYVSINSSWGINVPAATAVYVSNDGSAFTQVGATDSETYTVTDGIWTNYTMTVRAASVQSARYVKFVVTATTGHVWLEEVEVATAPIGAKDEIYVDGINTKINEGNTFIFTPDFGTITTEKANHKYTLNIVAAWDSAKSVYVVKTASLGVGDSTGSITLGSNEILIASHGWETDVTNPVYGSESNYNALGKIKIGDEISFTNVDLEGNVLGAASTIVINGVGEGGSVITPSSNLALNKTYTLSGVYSSNGSTADYPDETGKTMTDGLDAAIDGKYNDPAFVGFNIGTAEYKANGYASITVDLGAVYSVNKFTAFVASSFNIDAGIGAPSEVSVYVSNDNSTWTKAGSVNPEDVENASTVVALIALENSVNARYVQFRFVGKTNWIMVSEVEVYGATSGDSTSMGDVNADGKVDSADYLLIKRACFGSYKLTADEEARSDIDGSNKVDSTDYVLVKRMAFGTY